MAPIAFGGIDPGLDGAVAVFVPEGRSLYVFDIPTVGSGKDRRVNPGGLRDWLDQHRADRIAIERVFAMPSRRLTNGARVPMPASFAFKYGETCGVIRARVACVGIPHEYVTPQVWKKTLRLNGDKERSRLRALELFPDHTFLFARKKDHGRAEAALIAFWQSKQS